MIICILGADVKGLQRSTSYFDAGSWMLEQEGGDVVPLIVGEEGLCRIWKA
jgi:hypothetical protein